MRVVKITIAQVTDTHLFASNQETLKGVNTDQTLNLVIEKIKKLQPLPNLILLTGDLSQDETAASYHRLKTKLKSLNIPTYWIPGNHDKPQLMREILNEKPIFTDKSLIIGKWNLLLLDSTVKGEIGGYLSQDTLEWLKNELQGNKSPTIIALHHPPLKVGSVWMDKITLENGMELIDLVKQYQQVKLVVFGHIHSVFDVKIEGVNYLGSPSTCVQFQPKSEEFAIDNQLPGFRLLELKDDGSFQTKVIRA